MQYPQIQFYRGSLVRLASGRLKQVEDLSSEDFLESARLVNRSRHSSMSPTTTSSQNNRGQQKQQQQLMNAQRASSRVVDENNNSVFNSPEPTPSFDSPTMDLMETDYDNNEDDEDDEELDVVSAGDSTQQHADLMAAANNINIHRKQLDHSHLDATSTSSSSSSSNYDDLFIDSSVVRDFLEVGPPSSASSTSSSCTSGSPYNLPPVEGQLNHHFATTSSSSSPSSLVNLVVTSPPSANLTVLIKFFLESSRSIVFIEVPIEHPFFVFHRGWSSWNPQRTYDKFGLKCRKLKIGDTCISLIRRQRKQQNQQQQHQQESDQCNILFSSIKINE